MKELFEEQHKRQENKRRKRAAYRKRCKERKNLKKPKPKFSETFINHNNFSRTTCIHNDPTHEDSEELGFDFNKIFNEPKKSQGLQDTNQNQPKSKGLKHKKNKEVQRTPQKKEEPQKEMKSSKNSKK